MRTCPYAGFPTYTRRSVSKDGDSAKSPTREDIHTRYGLKTCG